jgi:hypothetical protein
VFRLPGKFPAVRLPPEPDLAAMATSAHSSASARGTPGCSSTVIRQATEAVPDGEEKQILGLMARSSHPDSARVLDVLGIWHPDGRVAREARNAARAMGRARVPARRRP